MSKFVIDACIYIIVTTHSSVQKASGPCCVHLVELQLSSVPASTHTPQVSRVRRVWHSRDRGVNKNGTRLPAGNNHEAYTRCAPRGRGRCRSDAAGLSVCPCGRSRVPEDYTRTTRRRARAKNVLARRGRLVSQSGENKGKSAMCEPSTLYRAGVKTRDGAFLRAPFRVLTPCKFAL